MRLCQSITAKVFVWLAAILVPVEALPVMACDCGSQSVSTKAKSTQAAHAAKCPHCAAGSRPRRSCCGGTATSSGPKGSCCGSKGSCCCCKGGSGSHGGPCQCSVNKSPPAPDPLPTDSRTNNTKTSLDSASDTVVTVVVVAPMLLAQAAQQSSRSASTSLERLSTLCRLVV